MELEDSDVEDAAAPNYPTSRNYAVQDCVHGGW
jgi:hypothetical protein